MVLKHGEQYMKGLSPKVFEIARKEIRDVNGVPSVVTELEDKVKALSCDLKAPPQCRRCCW